MIAVSLNVSGGVRLIKPAKLYMCTQNTTHTDTNGILTKNLNQIFLMGWGREEGGGGGLKHKQYARLSNDVICKSNHLHNVEHVVQSVFRIMLITF